MKRFAASALLVVVASGCGKDVPQSSPAVDLGTLSQAEVASSQPSACAGAIGTTVAPGWTAGPFVVSGGANARRFTFDGIRGERNVLVIENGDAAGKNAALVALVTFNGDLIALMLAGTTPQAVVVELAAHNVLEVEKLGAGEIRVTAASLSALPCSLGEIKVTRTKGAPNEATKQIKRPDSQALGILVLEGDGTRGGQVEAWLGNSLVAVTSSEQAPMAIALPLPAVSTLKLRATGKPGASFKAQAFDADTFAPAMALTAPPEGALVGTAPVHAEGTVGNDATAVDVLGVAGVIAASRFSADVTLAADARAVKATARDFCGNRASDCHTITRDTTLPVITVTGAADGAFVGTPVTLSWTVTDDHLSNVEARLDGNKVQSGLTISQEGAHELTIVARDTAGNTATTTVRFTIDRTPPVIAISGVTEGEVTAQAVKPVVTESDANLASAGITLDGQAFQSGTLIDAEGEHVLVVTAADKAGHSSSQTVHFAIDRTAPVISIGGVLDGEWRNAPATVTFSATDLHPGTVAGMLNDASIESGANVSAEGAYDLVVSASDAAGNSASKSVHFTIDKTAPLVSIESPVSGLATKASAVDVVVSATDAGPIGVVSIGGTTLTKGTDGKYRGTFTLSEGTNILSVVAFDAAGNSAQANVSVTRDSIPPQLSVTAPAEGAKVPSLTAAVSGSVSDTTALLLTVAGVVATVQPDGSFSTNVSLTAGSDTITIIATDAAGNSTMVTRNVRANAAAPSLVISSPSDNSSTSESSVTVQGTATPADSSDTVTVKVDGTSTIVGAGGTFSSTIALSEGAKTIVVEATDGYGLHTERSVTVTRSIPQDAGPTEDAGMPGVDAGDAATSPIVDAGTSPSNDAGAPSSSDSGLPAGVDAGTPTTPAPTIALQSPTEGAILGMPSIAVSGTVQDGTLPVMVKVNGTSATVAGRSFSAALALPEGNAAISVEVTDASGRSATAKRSISVDRTVPYLAISAPSTNPATVTSSPFRIVGTVGDTHLAGVTVNGEAVPVIAGSFTATVPLSAGNNDVTIEATDLAGNRNTMMQRLTVSSAPPTVQFLEPYDGAEAADAIQHVRVRVSAFAAVSGVQIGSGPATRAGSSDDYEANVALALGDNTVTATATDGNGLSGSASIKVHYRDPATEPLTVTGVSPTSGAAGIEPSALVSVGFNKAVDPTSVAGKLVVMARGASLPGEYSVARGAQIVTFAARDPLPEGETLTVRVSGMAAATGAGQGSDFVSQFTVRRPLTLVRGLVLDDDFQPVSGARVELVGPALSAQTSADGNWALFGAPEGATVVRYEGGTTSAGKALPSVRRRPGNTTRQAG